MTTTDKPNVDPKFKHAPNWADVQYLNDHGIWPKNEVPDWVAERATRWGCGPCSPMIQMCAAEFHIAEMEWSQKYDNESTTDEAAMAVKARLNRQRERVEGLGPVE